MAMIVSGIADAEQPPCGYPPPLAEPAIKLQAGTHQSHDHDDFRHVLGKLPILQRIECGKQGKG